MHYFKRPSWHMSEASVTPEAYVMNRRLAMGLGLGAAASLVPHGRAFAQQQGEPGAEYYPAATSPNYANAGRPVTTETQAVNYNNFYEFGTSKNVVRAAQALRTKPWKIKVDGLVENAFDIEFEDLLKKVQLEERIYRLRCVEAWSMTIPWTGFTLASFVKLAKPLGSAKFIRFETFKDTSQAPGQRQAFYPWPYVEGVTIEEAMNDLPLLVTGAYGKPLPRQMGAPIRLALPWKYGFKSIKSINRITFTDQRPRTFWEESGPNEYGFWANVNPQVSHPRWSQASERVIGPDEGRQPTVIYNGYGEQVASLYAGLTNERLFM
ncbi:protein-methionine-sulfoxide reductase catalytic subunit MsrP [Candidatus Raskinella chloraquaticus]|uniref:Protein-methionine-sulfoxide reductase catalytic subunit MsrP n=2 Tax=Candidatus Raskinella chloraquaticus TaxID=1951219 RepID=A0A1W9HV32_9HYPH|nr:MAG: mononuclear molybdenum enzyme YedY [Proteobacteria bacterium SG_bin8]